MAHRFLILVALWRLYSVLPAISVAFTTPPSTISRSAARRPRIAWRQLMAAEPPEVKDAPKEERKTGSKLSKRGADDADIEAWLDPKKAREKAKVALGKAVEAAKEAARDGADLVHRAQGITENIDRAAREAAKEAVDLAERAQDLTDAALEQASTGAREAVVAFEELEERARELRDRTLEKASLSAKEAAMALVELEERAQELTEAAVEAATLSTQEAKAAFEKAQQEVAELAGRRKVRDDEESFTVTTYVYRDSVWKDLEEGGTNARRLILYSLLGLGTALGGNLFGVTSGVLSLLPETAGKLQLDVIYPVKGFKRYVSSESGYEFQLPQEWLADQAVAVREQEERAKPLDPLSVKELRRRQRRLASGGGNRPDAAFGPPGGGRGENVSVVKSRLMPGFSLRGTLGDPTSAARKLITMAIAPAGSGRTGELLDAFEEVRGASSVYQFEYTVRADDSSFFLHSVGVIAARGDELFTLTVVAPQSEWAERREGLGRVARSFRLTR